MKQHVTIGMAGHIDHGKTTLTFSLTGINTDRLKEEQQRNISIELGFASFIDEAELEVSLVDVPGHENFIRQMIAGVAGIDMVILVIAADEGIMPQTREHLAILSLLGIDHGFVVMTKMDQAEPELLELILEDVEDTLAGTFLEKASIFKVDSLSGEGIPELKSALRTELMQMTKTASHTPFRLPVDHAFTVKGQGVVARGTVYNGNVKQGEQLKLLPANKAVRVRQIQTHGKEMDAAYEGQRTAINLGGVSLEEITRGDVLVEDDFFSVSNRVDIAFESLPVLKYPIKQRQRIKLHIGTTEVMGKIIFFDRNEVGKNEAEEIQCQLQLDESIVTTRSDRFILRRPSPTETIGGGWIIDPQAEKHRFGEQTIAELKLKQAGTPEERILALISDKKVASKDTILKLVSISDETFNIISQQLINIKQELFTSHAVFEQIKNSVLVKIDGFHDMFPMRQGIKKAELLSELKSMYPDTLINYTLETLQIEKTIHNEGQFLSLRHMSPSLPPQWKTKLERVEAVLIHQGAETEKWTELIASHHIPVAILTDYYYFLIHTGKACVLDEERLISKEAMSYLIDILASETNREPFTLQVAREALQLSRKNLVPFLELIDTLGYTARDDSLRTWI